MFSGLVGARGSSFRFSSCGMIAGQVHDLELRHLAFAFECLQFSNPGIGSLLIGDMHIERGISSANVWLQVGPRGTHVLACGWWIHPLAVIPKCNIRFCGSLPKKATRRLVCLAFVYFRALISIQRWNGFF